MIKDIQNMIIIMKEKIHEGKQKGMNAQMIAESESRVVKLEAFLNEHVKIEKQVNYLQDVIIEILTTVYQEDGFLLTKIKENVATFEPSNMYPFGKVQDVMDVINKNK
jgi:hypothetical protein